MKRDIELQLEEWRTSKRHLPIILRGARQIGKTYVVSQFAQKHFANFININFEFEKNAHQCFESLDPQKIVSEIEIIMDVDITAGNSLLFLDEIQECPNALMALRYFKEMMPDLHVIAAGSLLEFALEEENIRMPVGRVQFFHMKPLSFKEYLSATENDKIRKYIENVNLADQIPRSIHDQCLELVKNYCALGGMPAVIDEFKETKSLKKAQNMQSILLTTYQNDFGKYAKGALINYCKMIYTKAPELVSKQFKYVHISRDSQSRELKPALIKLAQAGILHLVYATAASGLPLNALVNDKKLKLLFLDIGLMKRASHLDIELLLNDDLLLINQGQLAEQFVGQELLAYQDILMPPELFFWARDKPNASAEVDYVTNIGNRIIPIEVKSGQSNKMKSLHIFMQEQELELGIKISGDELSQNKNILSIPLYLTSEIQRLLHC